MSNGTVRDYEWLVKLFGPELLEALLDELERLGAVVDRSPVTEGALLPRLAAERERLRALRNP
jgi:hypothetical protein